jgi:hypothetical protein
MGATGHVSKPKIQLDVYQTLSSFGGGVWDKTSNMHVLLTTFTYTFVCMSRKHMASTCTSILIM